MIMSGRDISITGFAVTYATDAEMRACTQRINALAEAGRLSAKVARTRPLAEARRAHELIEDKDRRLDGKIIAIPV
jgi:NADPH:quinone reductase-like Zn-dependent oxidoreductase